jgi:hypothetical protein
VKRIKVFALVWFCLLALVIVSYGAALPVMPTNFFSVPWLVWFLSASVSVLLTKILLYRWSIREPKIFLEIMAIMRKMLIVSLCIAVLVGLIFRSAWAGVIVWFLLAISWMWYEICHAVPEPEETHYLSESENM